MEAVECGKSMPSLCHKRRGHVDLMFFTLCVFQIVGMMADVCYSVWLDGIHVCSPYPCLCVHARKFVHCSAHRIVGMICTQSIE